MSVATRSTVILHGLAVVLAVAAVVMTAGSIRADREAREILARRGQTLSALEQRAGDLRAATARANDYIRTWTGGDLPTGLRSLLDGVPYEVDLRETIPLVDGWALRHYDVVLAEISFVRLGEVLEGLENRRPPRRIREVQILPSSTRGRGRVTLMIETIEPIGKDVRE